MCRLPKSSRVCTIIDLRNVSLAGMLNLHLHYPISKQVDYLVNMQLFTDGKRGIYKDSVWGQRKDMNYIYELYSYWVITNRFISM